MWSAVFWGAWAALTVAVWRHQYRTPPDIDDDRHMVAHIAKTYPTDTETGQPT